MLKKHILLTICLSFPTAMLAQSANDQVDQASAELMRNVEQFKIIQTYQKRLANALSQDESALVGRTLPDGLCLDGMDDVC
jgi:hypothetical protein